MSAPTLNLSPELWRTHSATFSGFIEQHAGIMPSGALVSLLLDRIIQIAIDERRTVWAWLARALQSKEAQAWIAKQSKKLDRRWDWEWIENDELRGIFEDNDDLYQLYLRRKRDVRALIEADVKAEAERKDHDVAGLLAMVRGGEGGEAGGPFGLDLSTTREATKQLPAVRDPIGSTDNHQQAAQLIAERRRREQAEARVTELEAVLAGLETLDAGRAAELEPVIIDIQPEPEEDPADLLSAGAMSLPTVDPAPLAPEDVPEPSAAAAVKRLKPAKGADTSTRRTAHSVQVSAPVTRRTRKRTK